MKAPSRPSDRPGGFLFLRSPGARRAGLAALAGATLALFFISRGKWSDAVIDSGTEWIYADSLSRGELLYRDVIYWFGPFTPYFQAAFLRVLGSGFPALVAAGIAGSAGSLAALFFALKKVTGRREATLWTALAVPALVFMPNGGGGILGMGYRIWHPATFTLLAVALAARSARADSRRSSGAAGALGPAVIGALVALAGLSRTEWGLMAGAAAILAVALRERLRGAFLRECLVVAATALLLWSAVLAGFGLVAGWKAVFGDGHLLLRGISEETRTFLVAFSGISDWRTGIPELLYSAAMWLGAFFLVEVLSLRSLDPERPRRRWPWLAGALAVLAISTLLGGAGGAVLFSGASLIGLAAFVAGSRRRGPRAAALSAFGFLAVVSSHRRVFHIGDSAYVAPPLLFAFVCAAGLLSLAVASERLAAARRKLRQALAAAVVLLVVFAFAGRAARYLGDVREPIPGTGGMLRANPGLNRELIAMAGALARETRPGEGLVVIPEGQILNLLSGRTNPLRQKLYIPGYLTRDNEPSLLEDLRRKRPSAVVILLRPTSEYGPSLFGTDYGRSIWRWIESNYVYRPLETSSRLHPAFGSRIFLLRERSGQREAGVAVGAASGTGK